MSNAAVIVNGVSKAYKGQGGSYSTALDNVNFTLQPGTTMGLIGRNGSGKSTLLKILAGVYKPTSGHAQLHGRVASVLEIGSGFHPELTGIENIFFYGGVMGFSRADIKARLDAIVDFSGIGAGIDKPVKTYSSGMFVRLASAVIVSLPYDVLILDEVIGMGDVAFSVQFSARLDELVANGATAIMASHNLNELFGCNHYLWLEQGKVKQYSHSNSILNEYDNFVRRLSPVTTYSQYNKNEDGTCLAINNVQLSNMVLCDTAGVPKSTFEYDEPVCMAVDICALTAGAPFPFMFTVTHNVSHVIVMGTSYNFVDPYYVVPQQTTRFMVQLPSSVFNAGGYAIDVHGFDEKGQGRRLKAGAVSFNVNEPPLGGFTQRGGKVPGIIRPPVKWIVAGT